MTQILRDISFGNFKKSSLGHQSLWILILVMSNLEKLPQLQQFTQSRSCKSYVKSIIFLSKPGSKTDQKSDIGASIYTNKLSFIQIYSKFRDIVASPTINQISKSLKITSKSRYLKVCVHNVRILPISNAEIYFSRVSVIY